MPQPGEQQESLQKKLLLPGFTGPLPPWWTSLGIPAGDEWWRGLGRIRTSARSWPRPRCGASRTAKTITSNSLPATRVLREKARGMRAKSRIANSAAGSPFIAYKQGAFLNPDETPVAFSLDLVAKDLDLILGLAEREGVEMDQGEANRVMARKAIDAGLGESDMSAVADYLRALYARAATLHCRQCGQPVERDTPSSIFEALVAAGEGRSALVCFPHRVGKKVSTAVVRESFEKAGYRRVLEEGEPVRIEDARLHPEEGRITVVPGATDDPEVIAIGTHYLRIAAFIEHAYIFLFINTSLLQGLKKPHECPAFGVRCTPEQPLGAPMVSSEGACAAYYRYRRHRTE